MPLMNTYFPAVLLMGLIGFLAYRSLAFRRVKNRIPALIKQGAIIIDVRTPGEFKEASSPRSMNIPLGELGGKVSQLNPTKPIILCCASGTRSQIAASFLRKNGFQRVENAGSWRNTLL